MDIEKISNLIKTKRKEKKLTYWGVSDNDRIFSNVIGDSLVIRALNSRLIAGKAKAVRHDFGKDLVLAYLG